MKPRFRLFFEVYEGRCVVVVTREVMRGMTFNISRNGRYFKTVAVFHRLCA